MNITELETKSREELIGLAKEMNMTNYSTLKKQDLVMRLLQGYTVQQGNIFCSGVLEIMTEGYGFFGRKHCCPVPRIFMSHNHK